MCFNPENRSSSSYACERVGNVGLRVNPSQQTTGHSREPKSMESRLFREEWRMDHEPTMGWGARASGLPCSASRRALVAVRRVLPLGETPTGAAEMVALLESPPPVRAQKFIPAFSPSHR